MSGEKHGAEHLKEYQVKDGDPGLPGAGRPPGSPNKIPALPPIHIDAMPFKTAALKRGETVDQYWARQSPKMLMYMMKRASMFVVYHEKGYADPVGAQCFKLLSKELVKDTRQRVVKGRDAAPVDRPGEGQTMKQYREKLVKMRESFIEDADIIDDIPDEVGQVDPMKGLNLGLGELEDEF